VPDLQIQDPDETRGDGMYLPALQDSYYNTRIIALASGDPLALTSVVRDRVAAVDPDLPLFEIASLHDAIYSDASVLDAFGVLFAVFGGGALFLAIVGVYGVVAFGVTQRTREFGVRIALGARREDILSLVMRQGARSVLIGTAIGLLLAIALHRAIAALIDFIEPGDLAVVGGVVGVLVITAVTALLVPARRAAGIEPLRALRLD
jgi:ABC-type antimicrobial peptide transport system permease subunit